MPQTVLKIILLFNIFVYSTQALLVRNQDSQQLSSDDNNNYQQNSLEEPRFASRNSSNVNEKSADKYGSASGGKNHVLDNFNHRYPDGSYEFRYELADGQARYERGYFNKVNNQKSLVVVGYYSYRMPDGKYLTVFYNADRFGYRQNQAITRDTLPNLPRTIEVPEAREVHEESIDVTTKNSSSFSEVSSTPKPNEI